MGYNIYRLFVVAFAYAGIVVGAGVATGIEPILYYTSFGTGGTSGVILATVLYGFVGYFVGLVGYTLKATSHKKAIYLLGGRYLGSLVDIIILLMMVGTGVAMVAGSGDLFRQEFGFPFWAGSLIMCILLAITLMLRLRKVVLAIGSIGPFLVLLLIIVAIYSISTRTGTFSELSARLAETRSILPDNIPNWFIASLNHVSMMTVAGVGMWLVVAGEENTKWVATLGGSLGGLCLGVILIMGHFTVLSRPDLYMSMVDGKLHLASLPILKIMNHISPVLGPILKLVTFGMIYNTAVSMFYVLIARFVEMETPKANLWVIIVLSAAFIGSFAGFVQLIGWVYPLAGYSGIILVGILLYSPVRMRKLGLQRH